jgi:outer membrane biosynthesis protein TonB
MPRVIAASAAVLLGLLAAFALVSCGSGSDAKLLPGNTAEEITENLESVKQLAAEGECVSAEDAAQEVSTEVEGLQGIDAKLKQALQEGATRLNEVVESCTEATTVETLEETTPEPTETEKQPNQAKKEKPAKEEVEKPEKQEKESGKEPPVPPTEPAEPPGQETTPPAEEGSSGGIGPGTEAQGGEG